MKITFDPQNSEDITQVERILAGGVAVTHPVERDEPEQPSPGPTETASAKPDPKVGVELDVNGTPWIAEVHAGTKTKNADGSWRKKRGTPDAEVEAAEEAAREELSFTPDPSPQPEVAATMPAEEPTVTSLDLVQLWGDVSARNLIDVSGLQAIYAKHGTSAEEMNTNATARAAVYADLKALADAPAAPVMPTAGGMPG